MERFPAKQFTFSKTTTTEQLHDLADKTINGPPVRNTSPEEKIDFDSKQKIKLTF